MTGRLIVSDDGIEIKGRFRRLRYQWRDIAGFWVREGSLKGHHQSLLLTWESADEGWVTVRGGGQHRLKGIKSHEEINQLNRLLEEKRRTASRG